MQKTIFQSLPFPTWTKFGEQIAISLSEVNDWSMLYIMSNALQSIVCIEKKIKQKANAARHKNEWNLLYRLII